VGLAEKAAAEKAGAEKVAAAWKAAADGGMNSGWAEIEADKQDLDYQQKIAKLILISPISLNPKE
jgi:hypothetical protein